jgi:hypothetical protein
MRSTLTRDLASWEQGALSAAELELRHPDRAVGLVALYERLSDLGDGPVPDAEAEWDRLRDRLEHPVAVAVRASVNPFHLRRLVARPLALAASFVLFGAAIGYAVAPEAVNRQLASFWDGVRSFFGNEPSEDEPAWLVEFEQPGVVPSDSVKDEGDVGRHRSGDDQDRREGHDDERRASDEGSGRDSGTDGGSDDDSSGSSNIAGGSSDISDGSGSGSDRSGSSGSGSSGSGGGDDSSSGSGGGDDSSSGSGGGDDDSSGEDDGSDGDDGGDDDGGDG